MLRNISGHIPNRRLASLLDHGLELLRRGAFGKVGRSDHGIEILGVKIEHAHFAQYRHSSNGAARQLSAEGLALGMRQDDQSVHRTQACLTR